MSSQGFQIPSLDAFFGLALGQLIGLLVLLGLAFRLCRPRSAPERNRPTYFGFRWSLILSILAALLLAAAFGKTASETPGTEYADIPIIVGKLLQGIAKAILAFALIRVALHPLREAGLVRRDKAVASAAAILGILVTLILVGLQSYTEYRYFQYLRGIEDPWADNMDTAVRLALGRMVLVNDAVYLIFGAVGLGCAVHALRKSAALEVHPDLIRGAKLMIAAGAVWIAKALMDIVFASLSADLQVDLILDSTWGEMSGAIATQTLDLLEALVIYTLFVVCFREAKDQLPL